MSLWNNTDAVESQPTWIDLTTFPTGTKLIFVDEDEALTEDAKAKGINSPGWHLYYEYTDSNSDTRYKTELLVAMRVPYSISGDNAADDTILTDINIYITSQPQDVEVTAGDVATFTVAAEANPTTALTYQWYVYNTVTEVWDDIVGETTDTLSITTSEADAGDYRVVITADTETAVSDAATLIVNPV